MTQRPSSIHPKSPAAVLIRRYPHNLSRAHDTYHFLTTELALQQTLPHALPQVI